MMLKEGMECPVCGKGKLEHRIQTEVLEYKGERKELEELDAFICDECGDGFYSRASERRQNIAFSDMKRRREGLLTVDEIKSIRKAHDLTQEELSLLLGMAPKTLARYENGTIIQSRSTDVLLRLLRDNPSNLTYLGRYQNDSREKSELQL